MTDGMAVRTVADNSLTGEVVVTGVIGKGSYQNTWDGDWHLETYDDYALLAAKLSPSATKLDVTAAGHWEEDWDQILTKCPDITIVTADGAITSIAPAVSQSTATAPVYTLDGQRVSQPTKGLYIINGKKVLLKFK